MPSGIVEAGRNRVRWRKDLSVSASQSWIDLLDPTPEELRESLPADVHDRAVEQLLSPAAHDDDPRPKIEAHGDYLFGVLLIAVEMREEDCVYYQEVDFILTIDRLLTIRKTPANGRPPYDCEPARHSCRDGDQVGMVIYHLIDDIGERFLDLVDDLTDEIEELEDGIETWPGDRIRRRISDLRHDMLGIRRTLAPLRDAVRQIVDDRIELDDGEVFPREVELSFGAAYDKLLRATDGLELARDLVAGVRDYHQAKVANDQNEVMKKFTVIASMLLLPTFIVGLYGQNFVKIPELSWSYGYGWSWGLIIVTSIGQLAFFKWRRWI